MAKTDWYSFLWKAIPKKEKNKAKLSFLKETTFFEDFSQWELDIVHDFLHERIFQSGEAIFEKGQPGAVLYFIFKGKVSIEVPSEGGAVRKLAELSEGAFFGELALLDDSPRSATARAAEDTVVLALARSELERMLQDRPFVAAPVYRSLAKITGERLKSTIERIQKEQQTGLKAVANG